MPCHLFITLCDLATASMPLCQALGINSDGYISKHDIQSMISISIYIIVYYIHIIFSSVRSSYSHPDLLVIHHHHPTHIFRSHRSSTLDFHFLSHYSYIKAIKLYKGNQWTHLLAICIPYGYNRTSLQGSAR